MVNRNIIALGGGPLFSDEKAAGIQQYIFNLTGKKKPKILLIPTATGDSDFMMARHIPQILRLGCQVDYLSFFTRTPADLRTYISQFDMVWVGGGNTKSMLAIWREWGLDTILKEFYEKGMVMGGISAGAICWFEQGITDSYADKIRLMPCMGWIKGAMCPHYDSETERRPIYQNLVKSGEVEIGYAAEENVFFHFQNENLYKIVSFREGAKGFQLTQEDLEIELDVEPK